MKRALLKTKDGSMTIHLPEIDEQYHSKHGALQEANHVFMKMGLEPLIGKFSKKPISILEIGFGTGLNCLITHDRAQKNNLVIDYTGVEAYPVTNEEWKAMDYGQLLDAVNANAIFQKMHELPWEVKEVLDNNFSLTKLKKDFKDINEKESYDLIYFDAFGARVQPELWTESIFKLMFESLKKEGVLVTYSAKGSVRRAMQATGFTVERLEGPPGKREMLRAVKMV